MKAHIGKMLLWVPYLLLFAFLWLVGLPVVAFLAWRDKWAWRASTAYPGRSVYSWPKWAWIWSNEEDGVLGAEWFRQKHLKDSPRWLAFKWCVLRNPVNNLRFVPWINPKPVQRQIRFLGVFDTEAEARLTGKMAWSYTWQGVFSSLYVIVPYRGSQYRFWIGWKFRPRDTLGIPPDDYRLPGVGFAIQLKRV